MNEEELISVVVPIYNVEKYLKRCIDSIIQQTYKNLEIILVDDGSPDNCGKICDDYAKTDKRIKVIHKKNGGLSDARNVGIKNATGKYITFIDSDDDILVDFIGYMYNLSKKNKADVVVADENLINNIFISKKVNEKIIEYKSKKDAIKDLLTLRLPVAAHGKLYLKTLFDDIEYPKGKIYEDNGTTYKVLLKCNRIIYTNQAKYNYYIRGNSITNSSMNKNKLDYIYLIDLECNDLLRIYSDISEEVEFARLIPRLSVYKQIINAKNKNNFIELKKELDNYFKINYKNFKKNQYIDFKRRISLYIIRFLPFMFKPFSKIYDYFK